MRYIKKKILKKFQNQHQIFTKNIAPGRVYTMLQVLSLLQTGEVRLYNSKMAQICIMCLNDQINCSPPEFGRVFVKNDRNKAFSFECLISFSY